MILNPTTLFVTLIGLLIGFNAGFYAGSVAIIGPLIVLFLMIIAISYNGKKAIIPMMAALLIGFILGIPKTKARTDYGVYQGVVIENKPNYFIFESDFHRYYVYEKECIREEGDMLTIEGKAEPLLFTSYEGYFSFEKQLNSKGVDSEIKPTSIETNWERPIRFAKRERDFLNQYDDPLTKGLISSILFGDKDYSNEAVSIAAGMNAIGFLSTSGILFQALMRWVDWFFYLGFKDKTSKTIAFAISIIYMPFGFRKIGVWRVFLGRIFDYFCFMSGKEGDAITKNSLTGLLLFAINPYNALSSGYLTGYGLAFFISLTGNVRNANFRTRDKEAIDFVFLMMFLAPLFIKGNEFHFLSPFYSFILLPFIYPFAALGILSFLSLPFITVLGLYSKFLLGFLSFLQTFDYGVTVGNFNETAIFAYYCGIAVFFMLLDWGLHHHAMKIGTLALSAFLLNVTPLTNLFVDQVTFVNVGQGDCIFIRNKDKTIMIDVGGNTSFDLAKEVTIPFLRKEKVSRLDYVIITHYDADHSGALDSLRHNFHVKNVVDSPSSFPLTIGDLTINNLNPGIPNSKEENDNSLVLHVNFMKKSWLFMGDAPVLVEKNILRDYPDIDCDILKVGHHGSDTSTCAEFLEKVTPEEAIISVGKKNKYGHPSDSVQVRLDRYGAKIRRTDIEGSITYRKYFGFL